MIELPSIQKTLVPSAASTLGEVPTASVCGRAATQALATQTPPVHTVPQEPQLKLSVAVSVHMPPHGFSPWGQVWMHEPAEHTALPPAAWQIVPQEPQLTGSTFVLTQLPPQDV
jgi:hypothetical protein